MLPIRIKVRILGSAESRPEWEAAFCAAVLALSTTMRGIELKNLRWPDIDFSHRLARVRRSKTEAGKRVIPLNDPAMFAIHRLYRRSQAIKATGPDDYVFYACEHGNIDPKKPQKSWRSAWRSLTRAVYCPSCELLQPPSAVCAEEKCKADISEIKSPLAGLRCHDLRHCAITELAEGQASDHVIMGIAGHVSRPDARTLFTHSSQGAAGRGPSTGKKQPSFGGLRHKPRHKGGAAEHDLIS